MQDTFKVKIKRQKTPESGSYWQSFELEREAGMNMTTCLQRIAAKPQTTDQEDTTPVAFEFACLEEVCG